jgi:hypothetical protein
MARTVKVRDSAGTLVLDLSSTGYELDFDGVAVGGTVWLRRETRSPFVDGFALDGATKDGKTAQITLRCVGATNVVVEGLLEDLVAAVEVPSWLLEVEVDGVSRTWRASCADSSWSHLTVEMENFFRTVVLTVPVQPTPAVSGV